MAVRREKEVKFSNVSSNRKILDTHIELYNSVDEVVTDCRNRPERIRGYAMDKKELRKDWHGVDSYDEALELLRVGYQPVADALKGALNVASKDGTRFSFKNNIQGFTPIVPLALKGVPNCMVDMTMKPIKAKVLDVYYDITATCEKPHDAFIKAGKALLGIIIDLEKQGYRFNLYAMQAYHDGKIADVLSVKIKSSNRPFDLKRMSFPLTHPAFFRVIGFDWEGKSPVTRDIGCGRGHPLSRDYNNEQLQYWVTNLFGNNACYISASKFIDSKYDAEALKEGLLDVFKKCNNRNKVA